MTMPIIKHTRYSSERFGDCEICGKWADSVYYRPDTGDFGHEKCLEKKEKKNEI